MPLVHPTSVVTFSSEDPNHPASNLLNRDTYRKWKCRGVGEGQAFVVLKFDQAVQITSVDIGNESSAFIEIFVGRSGGVGEVKYEPLLNSSILMSANESRSLDNICGVRSYPSTSLDKETSAQKWDLVKLVVSQIFNKQIQFGLTFAKFTAAPDPDAPAKIGAFALRKPLGAGDDDEDEPVRIGAMFAKSLANQQQKTGPDSDSSSTNAAIREVTQAITGAAQSSSVELVREALGKKPKLDGSSSTPSPSAFAPQLSSSGRKSSKGSGNGRKSPSGSSGRDNNLSNIPLRKQGAKTNLTPTPPPKSSPSPSSQGSGGSSGSSFGSGRRPDDAAKAAEDAAKPHKPFEKLFEDVVFVMSGFENPYRRNLRDRAIAMGAKCKQDWDASCTHLICAFVNTPKFREVRAARNNGKIVRKEWIERSFGARIRFPWRRFCLDRNDKGPESEEEILEEEEEEEIQIQEDGNEDPPTNGVQPMDVVESVLAGGDEEEVEIEEKVIPQRDGDDDDRPVAGKKRKRAAAALPLENGDDNEVVAKVNVDEAEMYNADTDIDESEEEKVQEKESRPSSSNVAESGEDTDFEPESDSAPEPVDDDSPGTCFFQYFTFFVCFSPTGPRFNEKDRIEQIICGKKGKVVKELKEEVDYLITNRADWSEDFSEAKSDNPNIVVIRAEWVLKCETENKMVPFDEFVIHPL